MDFLPKKETLTLKRKSEKWKSLQLSVDGKSKLAFDFFYMEK